MERRTKYTLSLVSLLLLPSLGLSQVYTVDIIGQPHATWEGNVWDLNATAEITFGIDNNNELNGFITVDVTNLGETPSQIVEFYMLRPFVGMGNGFGGFESASEYRTLSIPDTWIMDNAIPQTGVATTDYDHYISDPGDYFGMHTDLATDPLIYPPSQDTIQRGIFVFYFANLSGLNYETFGGENWYNNTTDPLVMLQWNGVGTNAENDISIGIGGGPNYIPTTPEPAEVALLAMVGLGGLLWTRRRFAKK